MATGGRRSPDDHRANDGDKLSSRMAADSLREVVLQAGLELLDRDGLRLTFESITYAKVFAYLDSKYSVKVTRGSVHERIWASHDDFRRDVLAESISYVPNNLPSQATPGPEMHVDGPDDFARRVGPSLFEEALSSPSFAQVQSVKVLASRFDDHSATESLRRVFNQRAEDTLVEARIRFPALLAELRLRPKADLGLSQDEISDLFFTLVAVLMDGGYLNFHAGSHDIALPVGFLFVPLEEDDPWRLVSIALRCFLDLLLEPETEPVEAFDAPPPPSAPDHPVVRPESRPLTPLLRRPRSELKRLLLAAGVELFLQGGPQLKPELLGYKAVFAHIKQSQGITVNRSSVHKRFWASNEDFHLEVLTRALVVPVHPLPTVAAAFERSPPENSTSDQQTAYHVIRRVTDALAELSSRSPEVRRVQQIKATLFDQTDSTAATALRAAVKQIDRERLERNKDQIQANILDLGFHVRPELGLTEGEALELIGVLTTTTVAGMIFDKLAGIDAVTRKFRIPRTGNSTEHDDWTPAGIALRSYIDHIYEIKPT